MNDIADICNTRRDSFGRSSVIRDPNDQQLRDLIDHLAFFAGWRGSKPATPADCPTFWEPRCWNDFILLITSLVGLACW